VLLDVEDFDSRQTYESYLASVRKQHSEVFDRTHTFRSATLFPPADPLSKFAERWKHEHPDPARAAAPSAPKAVQATRAPRAERFTAQVRAYYYGDYSSSPYEQQFLTEGRRLLDWLSEHPALDDENVQRWLFVGFSGPSSAPLRPSFGPWRRRHGEAYQACTCSCE
jgi:hypothetical protein